MFNLFKKKKPKTALSELYDIMYGPDAKAGYADLSKATEYAYRLLGDVVPKQEVASVAQGLHDGELPASTEDLALSTALSFFRRDELKEDLFLAQIQARMQMLEWLKEGRVNQTLGRVFEDDLYKRFKPGGT